MILSQNDVTRGMNLGDHGINELNASALCKLTISLPQFINGITIFE